MDNSVLLSPCISTIFALRTWLLRKALTDITDMLQKVSIHSTTVRLICLSGGSLKSQQARVLVGENQDRISQLYVSWSTDQKILEYIPDLYLLIEESGYI